MTTALLAIAALLVAATLLPLLRSPEWWVRVFDFPRLQTAALIAANLVGLAWASELFSEGGWPVRVGAVALALAGAYQLRRILPYTILGRTESMRERSEDGRRTFRLVISNVLMSNRDGERWLGTIRRADPDVLITLESNRWWQDEVFAQLRGDYPHAVELPQEDTYGMHLYSRLPLEDVRVLRRVDDIVPSIEATIVLAGGERVDAFFLHPMPPRPEFGQDTDRRDAELVLVAREVAERRAAAPDRPVLVAGDLNDVAWSDTTRLFQKLSGLADPRRGRGMMSTFHASYPLLRWPLDHVFHSEDLGLVEIERLGHVGSDHFPMAVSFAVDPAAAPAQETPAPDGEDLGEAAEIVVDAGERARERDPEDEPAPEER